MTGVAGEKLLLPAWVAWIVHCPVVRSVAVEPESAHTEGVVEAKLTGRFELALATSVIGTDGLNICSGIGPKLMD